eukprot:TRINITY_DN3221_c0_g1_i1.p1 TRINITY_DN3221_c0_g1~~TRINITY_DN3221_c0_g1_i1.p1  ORF type:complete len:191 (+),score=23.71 TRINITY_DN3221_c0_g1_i1:78-650(+)
MALAAVSDVESVAVEHSKFKRLTSVLLSFAILAFGFICGMTAVATFNANPIAGVAKQMEELGGPKDFCATKCEITDESMCGKAAGTAETIQDIVDLFCFKACTSEGSCDGNGQNYSNAYTKPLGKWGGQRHIQEDSTLEETKKMCSDIKQKNWCETKMAGIWVKDGLWKKIEQFPVCEWKATKGCKNKLE